MVNKHSDLSFGALRGLDFRVLLQMCGKLKIVGIIPASIKTNTLNI